MRLLVVRSCQGNTSRFLSRLPWRSSAAARYPGNRLPLSINYKINVYRIRPHCALCDGDSSSLSTFQQQLESGFKGHDPATRSHFFCSDLLTYSSFTSYQSCRFVSWKRFQTKQSFSNETVKSQPGGDAIISCQRTNSQKVTASSNSWAFDVWRSWAQKYIFVSRTSAILFHSYSVDKLQP